ncbi:sulfate transporter CysZ, partial [Oleiphilus sp. HI0079]|uniref:sulfate transporter CysZ n=2 Tax=Oleiphilus TaxID=141450 RepID=UPI0009EF25CA
KLIPRTVFRELRKLMYYLPRVLALFVLGLIPGVNAIVAIVWIVFSGWMMAIQYVDYPADNNGVSFDDLRKILGQHRGAALGFGLCTFGLTLVPIINLIILPAAVCGGVVFWVKKESTVSAVVAQN